MLYISLFFSALMLIVVNCFLADRSKPVGRAVLAAWICLPLGLLLGICILGLPIYLLNVLLVGVGGLACVYFATPRRVLVIWSLVATVASYGFGAFLGYTQVRDETNRFPCESLEERLSYEAHRDELPKRLGLNSSGDRVGSFNQDRLAEFDVAFERDLFKPKYVSRSGAFYTAEMRTLGIKELHEKEVQRFVNSFGFGVGRIMPPMYKNASTLKQESIPMSLLADERVRIPYHSFGESGTTTEQNSNGLHLDCVEDFLSPSRFGYIKDRQHVAGFQSHQFGYAHAFPQNKSESKQFLLRRLELVSLLNHEEPGV